MSGRAWHPDLVSWCSGPKYCTPYHQLPRITRPSALEQERRHLAVRPISRAKRPVHVSVLLFSALLMFGCVASQRSEPDSALVDLTSHLRRAGLVSQTGLTIVLVVDPLDCLTCYTPVARWLHWGWKHPRHFQIVFLRAPRPHEVRLLTPLRLAPDSNQILHGGYAIPTPLELVFRGGRLVYSDTLSPHKSSSRLLDLLGPDRSIEGLSAALKLVHQSGPYPGRLQ